MYALLSGLAVFFFIYTASSSWAENIEKQEQMELTLNKIVTEHDVTGYLRLVRGGSNNWKNPAEPLRMMLRKNFYCRYFELTASDFRYAFFPKYQ